MEKDPTKTCDIPTSNHDLASRARAALERVCSGHDLAAASHYYSPRFVDHVNELELRGLAGVARSVALYQQVLSDLSVEVHDQVVGGDRVTSRFVVRGTSHGRHVQFGGITISRFEGGLIVEDWSVVDTLALVRQLGAWRAVLAGLTQWRVLAGAR